MRDPHGRTVDYMRISVTDRCNERCSYCMPESFSDWLPKESILTYEEILQVVKVAVGMGFKRFRLTGGEPLVRRDLCGFVERLCQVPGVEVVTMTTNATLLAPVARRLRDAGLWGVNVSLDSLDPAKYRAVTRGKLVDALEGIDAALEVGFPSGVKLNVVLMKDVNEDSLWEIVKFAAERKTALTRSLRDHPLPRGEGAALTRSPAATDLSHGERGIVAVRFIELMPVSDGEVIGADRFLSIGSTMEIMRSHDELTPLPDAQMGAGPAKYWKLEKLGMKIGFIGAMTDEHFCESCNKVRLTADGYIRPCLGNHGEHDLKPALRGGTASEVGRGSQFEHGRLRPPSGPALAAAPEDREIGKVLRRALNEKPREHLFRENYTLTCPQFMYQWL